MGEEWKGVPGFGGHYEASSLGRVRVKDRVVTKRSPSGATMVKQSYKGRLLSPSRPDRDGHRKVHLGIDGKKISIGVHRLVLMAFYGAPKEGQEACHNNGIAYDNRPENLRWDSHISNNRDRIIHGTYAVGENHPMAKLSNADVLDIRESGISYQEAAMRYGIHKTTAHRICTGRTWKNC